MKTQISYAEALALICSLADNAGLGRKTYCLVRLHCQTVPEAVGLIQRLLENEAL